jgi:hypothetical protein
MKFNSKKYKSNSIGRIDGYFDWLKENLAFFFMRLRGIKNKKNELLGILDEIKIYKSKYESITKKNFSQASILEIGYGARPNRLLSLISLGYDAVGIDLDQPILKGEFSELFKIYHKNGLKRFVKSFLRHLIFDNHERRALEFVLNGQGVGLKIDKERFLVGDAGLFSFRPNSFDFIFSEDVFEHLTIQQIESLCINLGHALTDNGLVLISPCLYPGISGGHLVEWYPHTLKQNINRLSEPWEHLRKRRYHADCYLNELRVKDYFLILGKYFIIVDVINNSPGIGADYLTPDIRKELNNFDYDELLSDKWTFVCRKKLVN